MDWKSNSLKIKKNWEGQNFNRVNFLNAYNRLKFKIKLNFWKDKFSYQNH